MVCAELTGKPEFCLFISYYLPPSLCGPCLLTMPVDEKAKAKRMVCIFSVDTETPQVSEVREPSLVSSLARPQASTSHLVLNGWAALLCVSPRKYSSVYKNGKKKSELCLTPALGRSINSLIRNKLRIGGSRDSILGLLLTCCDLEEVIELCGFPLCEMKKTKWFPRPLLALKFSLHVKSKVSA